ncbi:MAG: hypothetical protein IT424_11500 [Pirellulales bacterium]|nr:hypothetical protein [Pirellulales bacterium]
MNRSTRLGTLLLAAAILAGWPHAIASAVSLAIANPSFESPAFGDGGFAFAILPALQGAWGWTMGDAAFVYNPSSAEYAGAAGNGAPAGADGAQIAGIYGNGDYVISQKLVGPDMTPGTADDPVIEPGTIYTITISIGQRAIGNPNSTYGGYDVQLRADTGAGLLYLGGETSAETPPPGTFITRQIQLISPSFTHPEAIGLPLVLYLRKPTSSATATIEYDDVRLEAVKISHIRNANFNEAGPVDAGDLALWQANFGANYLNATHNRGNANGDDYVDGRDLLQWQREFGSVSEATAGLNAAPLPEPAAIGLFVAGMLLLNQSLRRRGTTTAKRVLPSRECVVKAY